ncbi:aflNa/ hypD/ hypothetical protein [Aspergillus nomiae NRRL 13137]|uniref:Uncharacterized protein n=1 Tax=Aspergillus nomiae NRRL (strain ATCC 15546 / NRRL 13137 / CBS 260.88 / M93) TaxID=1509407 RepID=A0A0L1JC46_ASPN3|nr:aflNa/ hypD/ hypothetical protein [Aspergillus nomiae NRRL 13137]KNG89302.1 aflNa/ hypD/ hypothetical protein [Aspergillus nomiae NRRL 13137]
MMPWSETKLDCDWADFLTSSNAPLGKYSPASGRQRLWHHHPRFWHQRLIRPDHALTFFEWTPPTATADRQLVDSLMYVYGVRDIYIGLSVYVASIFGTPKSLGWTLLAFSAVAFADGAICWSWGHGEWGHWSYAPIVALIGTALSGLLD